MPACHIGLAVIWPVFLLEALVHVVARSRRWKQHLAYCLCPPARLGARDACTGKRIWLPQASWTVVDREMAERMERKLNFPMILIALCVIPLLALDYYQPEHHPLVHHLHNSVAQQPAPAAPQQTSAVASEIPAALAWAQLPAVRFATRIGEALIWTAFALEFTVMISVVDRKLRYCRQHWIDILVIVLPLIAFLRSLRLARLARLNQIGRFTRLYRLRGSVVRRSAAWWSRRLSNASCCAIRACISPSFRTRFLRKSAKPKDCARKSTTWSLKSVARKRPVAASRDPLRATAVIRENSSVPRV